MNNTLRIAGITNDSVVDGPGLRFTVFAQGCKHICDGCHNPQSHDENGGYAVCIYEILKAIDKNPLLDGVTISGGEPFLQTEAFAALSKEIAARGLNIMVYTGYTWEELIGNMETYKSFLNQIDILVDGPFIKELKSYSLKFKGSSNQRIIDAKKSLIKGTVLLWEE